ncbi:hypothetical protein H5410_013088 [Solanum commersonii]|uniref:Uncharacterized protein n=1 Tax=Solanum commersonii TaxID=4109 RepID=A0A9J6ATJ3_SOLCO|nr:hypothetical protein H5410_013088 [Solanum commersonii]
MWGLLKKVNAFDKKLKRARNIFIVGVIATGLLMFGIWNLKPNFESELVGSSDSNFLVNFDQQEIVNVAMGCKIRLAGDRSPLHLAPVREPTSRPR